MSTTAQPGGPNKAGQWSDIKPRLARLAAALPPESVRHDHVRLELEPVLSEKEVSQIETQIGVRLPEEYRSFLLQAGNGGAGPHYGICPLRKTASNKWETMDEDTVPPNDMDRLAEPFLHTTTFHPSDFLPAKPNEEDFETEHDYNCARDGWSERQWRVIEEHTSGLLTLCEIGCASWIGLVVSGAARGQMWENRIVDDAGIGPLLHHDGTPLTCAAWYRDWLDGLERRTVFATAGNSGLGRALPGEEHYLVSSTR